MFWKKEYQPSILKEASPKIVGCELSDKELQKFLNEIDVRFQIIDNPTRWCAFAQYYAYHHGFDIVKATSFSYMVSLFMTGMGISASTEMYFKEEQIEYIILDDLNNLKKEFASEEEQVKQLFEFIFEVYSENISEYEYATERLSLRLTPSEMEKFQSVQGENNKEKFKTLLNMI